MGVNVDILVCAGSDKSVIVDRHAVGGHDEGILVAGAVRVEAGRDASRVDLCLIGVVPHIGQIDHVALRAPVGDETLRSFHDEVGSGAYDEHGIVQEAIRRIKKDYPNLLVIADVCLCEYTSHGHCGLVRDGVILNDETLPLLAASAVSYAKAGGDIVAPSDMMDKRVQVIREALDQAGFVYTPIMSYSAKFASGYYGPFRDAAHSAPGFGDRRTYQMDPANGREAMREVEEDIAEGADLIIAKPAMAYMDIIKDIRMNCNIPIVAYNVSGEYAMVKAASANGWIDEKKIVMENLVGMKRAGADMIITYHALEAAKWIREEENEGGR